MEEEAVGSAGTSSAITATATGTVDSVMTNEPTCDMPTEITPGGTDLQPPRIQYSTDLRKELSLDVLASLRGSAADDATPIEESMLDLATVRVDMDFISELSSLGLPLDHNDSSATDTLVPSSATTLVEPPHASGSAGAPLASDIPLPVDDSSLLPPGPATADSLPSLPSDELSAEVSFDALMNSSSSAAGAFVENDDSSFSVSTTMSFTHVTPPVVPSASDRSNPVFSAFTLVSSTEDNSGVGDASAELQSSHALEELPESGLAGPPGFEVALFSHVPVEPVSSPATPFLVGDGDPATVKPYDDSYKSLPSPPCLPVVSDAAIGGPVHTRLVLPPSNRPATSQHPESEVSASEPLPVAFSPVLLTTGDHAADSSPATDELPFVEMQSCTPGDMDLTGSSVASLEALSSALETLWAPADLPSSHTPMALDSPPLASTSLPSADAAPADDDVRGGSSVFTSPPLPNVVTVPVPNSSPALKSLPVEIGLCLSNSDGLYSTTSSTPLVTPAVNATVPGVPPSSLPSLVPPKVFTLSDSISSPPLTARFWDVPKPLSPGISLSLYFDGSRSSFRAGKINRKRRSAEAGGDLRDMKGKGLNDIDKLEEVAELESMLEAQKRMVKWQIDEIQRIATLQFQLTGSNPLSEEAMWEVLGVKGGGKKSGDPLPPEALKGLLEIFAVKDTLTKKEARDISFASGASLTQVREYFAAQRSFVRRLVQQAHDEAGRLGIRNASEQSQQITVLNSISEIEKDLGFDKLSGAESIEKIIEAMRAEKGFAGQIQLLQVILRTDSSVLILRRFLEKGGLKMLGGWLAEAASEQQTSVICHLLKVLDHLPLSNAVSHQMALLVQNVNKLRFHDTSAVAGQARSLFTKWVKLFSPKTEAKAAGSPGSKLPAGSAAPSGGLKRNRYVGVESDSDPAVAQSVPGSRKKKVRAEEVLQQGTKAPPTAVLDSPSLNGVPQGVSDNPSLTPSVSVPPPVRQRWSSTLQPSESAVAAVSVSRKRLASKSLGDQLKDRHKVLPVEHNHLGKSPNSKPATISKTSRPLSTDDIYKAKKLERLMQEPILKSKRKPVAAPQEQSVVQDEIPQPGGAPKKPLSPAIPSDLGALKRETSSSSAGSWRGGVFIAKSSQDKQLTATRTQLPMRSPEKHGIKMSIMPTSLREQSPPGFVTCNLSDNMAYNRDSNFPAPMETDPLPQSLSGSSGQGWSGNLHYGRSSQDPAAVAARPLGPVSAALNSTVSKDPSHPIHSQLFISENLGTSNPIAKSKPAVLGNVRKPPASSKPSEGRPDERSGLSALRVMSLVEESGMDVMGSKDQRGIEQEVGKGNHAKPSSRERSLSDFYAALRASMVRWRIPPDYQPDNQWNVAAGEDSKEREVQSGRVKREEEAYYPELSAVPDDPKDPWEEEPNYDDSLTLEIFVDNGQRKVSTEVNNQPDISKPTVMNVVPSIGPDVLGNNMLNSVPNSNHGQELTGKRLSKVPPVVKGLDLVLQQLSSGGGGGTHDPDLLALLLRNPELVSQLTSGQAFTPSAIANHQGVFMQPLDPLKEQQFSSGGNNEAAGLSNPAVGDPGLERLITSNNSKALEIPLQPGRSESSLDQTPPETMRIQDSIPMMPSHPGMGQQQATGFVPPHGGVDNRFLAPQMPSVVARNNLPDTSGWEQHRGPLPAPPPPPPGPPPRQQPVINQVLQQQPPLPNQPNKQSNWPEPQGWVGMGRPPTLNPPPQVRMGPEQQLRTRQTLMSRNARLPDYVGMVGMPPQVEGGRVTGVVSQPEVQHRERPWLNGSHGDNNIIMHSNQDSSAIRNQRWQQPRPPVRPPDHHAPVRPDVPGPPDQYTRSGNRDFTDFNSSRQTSLVDSRPGWVPNERARPILPPFQGAYALPPPPPYPAPIWQGQDGNRRLVQGGGQVNPFPPGRDQRQSQQQMWHNGMGPASRQMWRGQQ